MKEPDTEYRDEQLRSYRSVALVVDTVMVSAIPALILGVLAIPMGRPASEGLIVGCLVGLALMVACTADPDVRAGWLARTAQDSEDDQAELDRQWREEQNRPDDEYVGW